MNERPSLRELNAAGWSSDRRATIDSDLSALEKEGYVVFPVAVNFLREFSGLCLLIDHGGPDEIWFSATRACLMLAPAWIRNYSARAGTNVLPVGAANREHLVLLIGEDGRWFGGYDNEFGQIGTDVLSCLDNLILDEGFDPRL